MKPDGRRFCPLIPQLLSLPREMIRRNECLRSRSGRLNCKVLTDVQGDGIRHYTEPVVSSQRQEVQQEEHRCSPRTGLHSHAC